MTWGPGAIRGRAGPFFAPRPRCAAGNAGVGTSPHAFTRLAGIQAKYAAYGRRLGDARLSMIVGAGQLSGSWGHAHATRSLCANLSRGEVH